MPSQHWCIGSEFLRIHAVSALWDLAIDMLNVPNFHRPLAPGGSTFGYTC